MNLQDPSAVLRRVAFRAARLAAWWLPGGRISAFGSGDDKIGSILAINLDRQPLRWRRLLRELGRFRTATGARLPTIVQRLSAVDARDGRAVAATADVDAMYRIGDHLFVQPDARLADCFDTELPIRMTRQEVAVARSHIEAWKAIAAGPHRHVLVLEDDVWFRRSAARVIELGWRAALRRRGNDGGPHLLYLSFKDAGGMATRADACDALFQPVRGLWFLSGYVLSRDGAAALLKAMPVVGPADLWMNYRFAELGALALTRPAIMQREDGESDNAYSILPFLARAGTVDAGAPPARPDRPPHGLTLAWTAGEGEGLAMAISMLGLRTRAFAGSEPELSAAELVAVGEVFDAVVDPPLDENALRAAIERSDARFIIESEATGPHGPWALRLPPARTSVVDAADPRWDPICRLLGLAPPAEEYPTRAPVGTGMFRDERLSPPQPLAANAATKVMPMDDSPWVLPPSAAWQPRQIDNRVNISPIRTARMSRAVHPRELITLVETFPGNLAAFTREGVVELPESKQLVLSVAADGEVRPFRSGAFASARMFPYGRFEAEIRAAAGPGLVTGFFLHRDTPRQEIDIELLGDDPRQMLVNVYFNPGDDGAALGFGYRGSPCRIDLGFDASADFHAYAIEWSRDRISWSVDGIVVHERRSWDPTPVPHLPMRVHANLWAPRSIELAGIVDLTALPASAEFRRVVLLADEEA
ncbi:MAG TPA: family 16 glycosylhydrolase [Allosphingosinicella sp.]|nr:family 16 glycosylhydrolase [Allosphingosinicella sp.]